MSVKSFLDQVSELPIQVPEVLESLADDKSDELVLELLLPEVLELLFFVRLLLANDVLVCQSEAA